MTMRMPLTIGLLTALPIATFADEPPTKDEVAALVKQLKDNDPSKRNKAGRALENLDSAAKDAIPVLIEALKDRQPEFNLAPTVAKALGKIGKPAVPALIEALEVKDGKVQAYAAMALKQIGMDAKAAVPALIEVVKKYKDPAHIARLNSIAALGKIGPAAKDAVPLLIDISKEKPPLSAARLAAVTALGQIGPEAKAAAPTLIDLLGEEETKAGPLRIEAARSLGLIGSASGEEAASALVALVENKKLGPARIVAINALGQLGPTAKNAVTALKKAGEDKELKAAADGAIKIIEK
jgi:HEAT repeat protein